MGLWASKTHLKLGNKEITKVMGVRAYMVFYKMDWFVFRRSVVRESIACVAFGWCWLDCVLMVS